MHVHSFYTFQGFRNFCSLKLVNGGLKAIPMSSIHDLDKLNIKLVLKNINIIHETDDRLTNGLEDATVFGFHNTDYFMIRIPLVLPIGHYHKLLT